MSTKIIFKRNGKVIEKEDSRNIFECLRDLVKWYETIKTG